MRRPHIGNATESISRLAIAVTCLGTRLKAAGAASLSDYLKKHVK